MQFWVQRRGGFDHTCFKLYLIPADANEIDIISSSLLCGDIEVDLSMGLSLIEWGSAAPTAAVEQIAGLDGPFRILVTPDLAGTVSRFAPREFASNCDRCELDMKIHLSFAEVMVEQVPYILAQRLIVRIQEIGQSRFPGDGFDTYAEWMGQRTPSVFRMTGPHPNIVDFTQLTAGDYSVMADNALKTLRQRDDPDKIFST
jgi:hypothetical protein